MVALIQRILIVWVICSGGLFSQGEEGDKFRKIEQELAAEASVCSTSLLRTMYGNKNSIIKSRVGLALSYLFPSLRRLENIYYNQIKPYMTEPEPEQFFELLAKALDIDFHYDPNYQEQIPSQGGLIAVVNNSLGHVNTIGAFMAHTKVRKDIKILGNKVLLNIPELHHYLIPYDMNDRDISFLRMNRNKFSLQAALDHLQSGGSLILLPGEDMASTSTIIGRAFENTWLNPYGELIEDAQVPVLPVYVNSQSRSRFSLFSLFGPSFRERALAAELYGAKGQEFRVIFGHLVSPENLKSHLSHPERLADALRTHSLLLGGDDEVIVGAFSRLFKRYKRKSHLKTQKLSLTHAQTIVQPLDKNEVADEVAALPSETLIQDVAGKQFFLVKKHQAEKVVREIGRLREEIFRAENEGTGKAIDLDTYDEDYYHLFAWDPKEGEIIGAYRLGLGDELLAKNGADGLYTKSLFGYNATFLQTLGSVLELGRSFIVPKYRKRLLPYIFMAIAKVLVKFPEIDALIGPVSISGDRSLVSMLVTTSYLMHNYRARAHQTQLIDPPNPFSVSTLFSHGSMLNFLETIGDLRELGKYVETLEGNKELPPLVSIYAELGALFFAFNVDYDFNRAVDGMIVVYTDNFSEKTFNTLFRDQAEEYKRLRSQIWQERLNIGN